MNGFIGIEMYIIVIVIVGIKRQCIANTARKACECVTVFNCITARLSRLYDGNGHRIDSHVFACIFRKCTTFARRVLVFGPVLVLVCRRRALLVLPQYL